MNRNYEKLLELWMEKYGLEDLEILPLRVAFTHASYKGLFQENEYIEDYERLEFVGDSVLDLLIAHELFNRTDLSEGEMTLVRKNHVQNSELAQIFDKLDLSRFILKPPAYRLTEKDKGSIIEAIFGAVFLFLSYADCRRLWQQFREDCDLPFLEIEDIHRTSLVSLFLNHFGVNSKNPKGDLQELLQKLGLAKPTYTVIDEQGPAHERTFTIQVTIQNYLVRQFREKGHGDSKRKAEVDAAQRLLQRIVANPVGILGYHFDRLIHFVRDPSSFKEFILSHLPEEHLPHPELNSSMPPTAQEPKFEESQKKDEEHLSPLLISPKLEPKSALNMFCPQNKLPLPEYKLVRRIGPDHAPRFVARVTLRLPNQKILTAEGEGLSKKAAEKAAARRIIEIINKGKH